MPQTAMCHQKFELLVDGLAFIGHPVCVDSERKWRFKGEKVENNGNTNNTRGGMESKGASPAAVKEGSEASSVTELQPEQDGWLQFFHLVFVCDLPDPSSSASGNLSKYFEIIYEQVAFPVTAVLFQEQVLKNFVEGECDKLGALKDLALSEGLFFMFLNLENGLTFLTGHPYEEYARKCLEESTIASAMKDLYDAIKASKVANLTINDFSIELQLPPHLDTLLHNDDEAELNYLDSPDEEDSPGWGPEMNFGWRLPTLAPWKSLLMLDDPADGGEPFPGLKGPHFSPEDRAAADGLTRFLETISVTLS
jgi:hypothetical protein